VHFFYGQRWTAFFSCVFLAFWISSFEKVLFISVAHFIGSLILGEFFELSVYSGYQSFVWCIDSKYFLPLCGWSLQAEATMEGD
jgi:hypothetical protein